MTKMLYVYTVPILLLLGLFIVSFGDTGDMAGEKPKDVPTTKPDPSVVLGKMSINGVELQYSGPVDSAEGTSAIVGISIVNTQDAEVCFAMTRIEERLSFRVSVKSPKGKISNFQTYGVACDRAGQGVLSLNSGKSLEEHLDLGRYLTDGLGIYQVTVMRGYNGVIHFPGYELRIDVPLTLVAEKPKKP